MPTFKREKITKNTIFFHLNFVQRYEKHCSTDSIGNSSQFIALNAAFGQMYKVSLDERIDKSPLVVEGKVVGSHCFRSSDGNIYTANKVKITSVLKGDYAGGFLNIITWGGELNDEIQTWTHLLTLSNGDYGLFFLEPTRLDYPTSTNDLLPFDVYAGVQGFIRFSKNEFESWVASDPFWAYSDIEEDLYARIENKIKRPLVRKVGVESQIKNGVRYHFKNIKLDGLTITFDLYVNSLIGTKRLYQSGIQLKYNTDFFGANIATNGNLLLQDAGISLISGCDLTKSDISSEKARIELVSTAGNFNNLTIIDASEQLLAQGKITIQNIFSEPNIEYDIAEVKSLNRFFNGEVLQAFDTIVVEGDWKNIEGGVFEIRDIGPLSLRAGTDDLLTITGTGFGNTRGSSFVQFTNAFEGITNGVQWIEPLPTDYNLWSDTKIEVFVPSVAKGGVYTEYAGTGKIRVKVGSQTRTSAQTVTVRLAADNRALTDAGSSELRRKKVRLIGEFGEDGGYTLYYNDAFKGLSGAVPAFERALCTWIQSSNVNFRIKTLAEIDPVYQQYACQVLLGPLPSGTSSSTKAITVKNYYLGCQAPNGDVIKGTLKKFDIFFRQGADWQGNLDMESYALHELGHAQLLLHVNQTDDVMYYEILGTKRILKAGDTEGGNYIKSISIVNESNCSIARMVPNSDCSLIPTNEAVQNIRIQYVPNPTSNQITIESSIVIDEIKIFDNLGKSIFTFSPNSNKAVLDVLEINSGVYFGIIKSGNAYQNVKFIKI
jgi:hypothetical protein